MNRKIITTEDGSTSILMQDWGETYHSIHGARQEAQHVYIENGLRFLFSENKKEFAVLEMGFGTGLNALLTAEVAETNTLQITYTAVEGYPINESEWGELNYGNSSDKSEKIFEKLHTVIWETEQQITPFFSIVKTNQQFQTLCLNNTFDLIYFDVFGYNYQPELWTEAIFLKMKELLNPNGVLVTYACKGVVNKILKNLGFEVQKLKGPPGKREMTRAVLIKK